MIIILDLTIHVIYTVVRCVTFNTINFFFLYFNVLFNWFQVKAHWRLGPHLPTLKEANTIMILWLCVSCIELSLSIYNVHHQIVAIILLTKALLPLIILLAPVHASSFQLASPLVFIKLFFFGINYKVVTTFPKKKKFIKFYFLSKKPR